MNTNNLQNLLETSILLSAITCTWIQKTKSLFKSSKYLVIYSFIVNMILGILFCNSYTDISFPTSLWAGIFSFIGADSIYKTLEGKLLSHTEIRAKKISTKNVDKKISKTILDNISVEKELTK